MSVLLEEYRNTRDGLRFGFAVGKVRVLETRLLDRATLERLVDAPGFSEQKRILSETVYGRYLESAQTPAEVESALEDALESAFRFLDEAGLPATVVRFFRARFDFANLKAALKARALGTVVEGLLVSHGMVEPEAFEGPLEDLPEPLEAVVREAARLKDEESEGGVDLMAIDALVDKALFAELMSLADESGSSFLVTVARLMVDLANLKTHVRAHHADSTVERVAGMLLEGGSFTVAKLTKPYRLPEPDALAAFERLFGLKGEPLTAADDAGDLDVIVDNALVAAVRRGRRPEPGAEDVIAYVLAREAEAQVLRVALLGKMAGLDSVVLHRRMRASFR